MSVNSTFARFILNGLAATLLHYAVLTTLIEVAHISLAGIANGVAAVFGISASYLGNRYFVFRSAAAHVQTLPAFLMLYSAIALMHVGVLGVWTDFAKLPYTVGFLIGTAGSVLISFFGNRYLVFPSDPGPMGMELSHDGRGAPVQSPGAVSESDAGMETATAKASCSIKENMVVTEWRKPSVM